MRSFARPLAIPFAFLFVGTNPLSAQLTAGVMEASIRDAHSPAVAVSIIIRGAPGFREVIQTDSQGMFSLALPYGEYQLSLATGRTRAPSTVSVFIVPLATTRVTLSLDTSGALHMSDENTVPGIWSDQVRAQRYPEAFSLSSVLLSREPAIVTEPLNFSGLADGRLAIASGRGVSWTATQYQFHGLDATDVYQPGRSAILPDVQALDYITVRSAFALTTSAAYAAEVNSFLAQPGQRWHGAIASAGTSSFLSSTNLPPPADRGSVLQPDRFHWLTRDHLEFGGPLTQRADLFVSGTGQWTSQTVPLASLAAEQHSRLLFGNARTRIRATPRDQFDGLFSGSRIDLANGGIPAGIEAFVGRRMSPQFTLPGGFAGQAKTDHLDVLQAGWIHQAPPESRFGILQLRYGHSFAHLATRPALQSTPGQSRIELLGSTITGAPPLDNLGVRTRRQIAIAWQPQSVHTAGTGHRISLGGGWNTGAARNRFTTPSGANLITANAAPAFVVEYNTPLDTRAQVRTMSAYAADHIALTQTLAINLGALADFSRGSLPAQSSPAGPLAAARIFRGQPDLISWNSLSPRAGFAWRVPHTHGLVVRGAYLRLYSPLAGRYLDFGNPNSLGGSEYQWIDRNSDRWFQPGEQGPLSLRFGGPYSSIAPSLGRPYSDEFDVGAEFAVVRKTVAAIQLFRRDEKQRLAVIDTGVPTQAFIAHSVLDPGPDSISGTSDDQQLTVYDQNSGTLGQDRYLLTNPAGLRMLNTGLLAEIRTEWHGAFFQASFIAEKSYGPTNPGNAVFENDPGVLTTGPFIDPNAAIHAAGRMFTDRAYIGKILASYRLPRRWSGIELASVADYTDGLVFARQLLVTGLTQGPLLVAATVRGSPEGGNRAQYVINWNLRLRREFPLPIGKIVAFADVMNVTNAGQSIQQNDLTGPSFNQRLPVAIQPPRFVRFELRYDF
jgi:hypothetical protein